MRRWGSCSATSYRQRAPSSPPSWPVSSAREAIGLAYLRRTLRTTTTIDVAAPAELVFRLAYEPLRWPMLLAHYERAREISRDGDAVVCEFVARRTFVPLLGIGIPVIWRSRTWAEPDRLRLRFRHLAGATRGMDVTWRIEPIDGGCRVTIEHDFSPRVRAWAALVDWTFTKPIANRTLQGFKAMAEALAPGLASGGRPMHRS